MAVTTIDFTPSVLAPFEFQPTFDGSVYTCTVTWNLFGQRYYIQCTTLTGSLVFNMALVPSPNDYPINLLAGYFKTTTMVFYESSNQFVVTS